MLRDSVQREFRVGSELLKRLGTVLFLLIIVNACSLPRRAPTPLTILATSDFHGAVESEFKEKASGRPLGGAAVLAATLARERQRNPEGTLLLDAGDLLQGSAVSNLTRGKVVVDLFNRLGYDAATLGNHEFDWGIDVLRARRAEAHFPLLAANVVERSTGRTPDWATPYQIFRRRGVRIAVVGLATETTPAETIAKNVEPYEFRDPVAAAVHWAKELLPEQADVLVLLCHFGLSEGDVFGTELKRVAAAMKGPVILVGGHTHELHSEPLSGVATVQPGRNGYHLGRIDFVFDPSVRDLVDPNVSIVPVYGDEVMPDAAIAERARAYRAEVDTILAEEIGESAVALELDQNLECRLGNLVTDRMRERFGVDIALQNTLGLRATVPAGKVKYGDLFKALPFDNTVVVVPMSASQISRLLNEGDAEGRVVFASGLRYVRTASKPKGERIEIVPALDPARTYRVAMNNYMAGGGAGFGSMKEVPGAEDSGVILRDLVADWFRAQRGAGAMVTAALDGRLEAKP